MSVKTMVGFLFGGLDWNRTSDTRIFNPHFLVFAIVDKYSCNLFKSISYCFETVFVTSAIIDLYSPK